jgi:hypothetical protein
MRIHGQVMPTDLQQAWQQTSNAREQAEMLQIQQLWNSGAQQQARELAREAFNRHRGRFWRFVRRPGNGALRSYFTDAGMEFRGGPTSAPVYRNPANVNEVERMTLEHRMRLTDDPTRALDGANLQLVLGDENSVALELLRRFDPFLAP